MTTSLKTWSCYASDNTPLTESDKYYFRAKTKRHIHDIVLGRFMELVESKQFSKKLLAQKLDAHPAQVTRWLASPGNWTIDTLSDLLLAMSCQLAARADPINDEMKANFVHPTSVQRYEGTTKAAKSAPPASADATIISSSSAPILTDTRKTTESEAA